MAKIGEAAPKTAVETPEGLSNKLTISSDVEGEMQEVVLVTGNIGAGKTFLAASASAYFPEKLPADEPTELKDMFWVQFDSRATAGFKHNNLKVATFDIDRYMSRPDLWKKANQPPTIIETIKVALEEAAAFAKEYGPGAQIVVDTISKMDYKMLLYHMEVSDKEAAMTGKPNPYRKFDLNLRAHDLIHETLKRLGFLTIIYCCHEKALGSDADKSQATRVVGGAIWGPDLTGAAPKFYKSDASLQVCMETTRGMKGEVVRKMLLGNSEHETKNRYAGLLPDVMEPHLGKALSKIRGK